MEPNYKNNKRYNTAKKPIRQPLFFTWLIKTLSDVVISFRKHKIEKINMEGLKPPYLMLSNHMAFCDFEFAAKVTWPHRVNNVINIDAYHRRPWLMELIGGIATRKFTNDLALVRTISHVFKRGDVVGMYPEARYSPCGTINYLPDALGKLIKLFKVPVVTVVQRGNHLYSPVWNWTKKRKVPFHTTATKLLTPEEIANLSAEEITEKVRNALYYDEYEYQKQNGILITEKNRAEGINKILYQCPSCKKEHVMDSKGCEVFCTECGKRYRLNEDGTLSATSGETEFTHVPDWFNWQKENVRKEIESGNYKLCEEMDVYSFPRCWKFINLGKATITHDLENGFTIKGFYRGKEYEINRRPLQNNGLHVEYEFPRLRKEDCIDISTENDSFYCYPKRKDIVTKIGFATEIMYQIHKERQAKN